MIKFENTEVTGWEHAIRGMRNPLNSHEKSDSKIVNLTLKAHELAPGVESLNYEPCIPYTSIGPNDFNLMKRLRNAGTDHRKFMRMITVYVDITAPLYWLHEFDTYKVGVVRNSCSFMHKGVSKEFEITDFSIKDERVYKILSPLEKPTYKLKYPYETDEYKLYTDHNGRTYRVYRNGFVIREGFQYIDNYGSGRTRSFEEKEATIYQNRNGYFVIKLAGRDGGHMLLSRLVASLWCDKPEGATQVDHINGDKGNNSAENLRWVTPSENMQSAVASGLYEELSGFHKAYRLWKHWTNIVPIEKRYEFLNDSKNGMTHVELAEKWGITPQQANNLRYDLKTSENEDLFQLCYVYDKLLERLNYLRALYLETKDESIFQAIRCLIPQGYMQKSTFMLNYEVLANMYHGRKNHRLDEWRVGFCDWIKTLPYSELITGEFKEER